MATKVTTKMIIIARTKNYMRLIFFPIPFVFCLLFVIPSYSIAKENTDLDNSKIQSLYDALDTFWQNGNYNKVIKNGEDLLLKINQIPESKSASEQLTYGTTGYMIPFGLLCPLMWPEILGRFGDFSKSKISGWDDKLVPNNIYDPLDRYLTKNQQRNLYRMLGLSAVRSGDNKRVTKYLKNYLDIEEEFRLTITREDRRAGYISTYYKDIEHLIEALINLEKIWEAFQYAEYSKAKTISELLVSSSLTQKDSVRREVVRKINICRAQSEAMASKAYVSMDDLKQLHRKVQVIEKLESKNEGFGSVFFLTKNICPSHVNKGDLDLLDKNDAFISFFCFEDFLLSIIYHSGEILSWSQQKISRQDLSALVKEFSELIQKQQESFTASASKLYSILIKPILPSLKENGIKRIVISPHSVLRNLSFAGLKGDQFLISDFDISYIFSANFLSILKDRKRKKDLEDIRALIVGNPVNIIYNQTSLPEAELEADEITRLFKERYSTSSIISLKGKSATEARVRNEMSQSNFIHLATHSKINRSDGDNSFIYLADDGMSDGILYAHELYNILPISPWELVVLSSCESGAVDLKVGDDPYGLTRSLFFSGANRVISTFWDISDRSTSKIMIKFYKKYLLDEVSAVSALCRTLAEESTSGDLTWIAFKIEGLL